MAEENNVVQKLKQISKIKKLSEIDKEMAEMQQHLQDNPNDENAQIVLHVCEIQRKSLLQELAHVAISTGKQLNDEQLSSAIQEGISAGVIMSLCGCNLVYDNHTRGYVAIYDDDDNLSKKGYVACMYDKYICSELQKETILKTAIETFSMAASLHYMIDEGNVNLYNAAQAMIRNMKIEQIYSNNTKAYSDMANRTLNEMIILAHDYTSPLDKDGTIAYETTQTVLDTLKQGLVPVALASKKTF